MREAVSINIFAPAEQVWSVLSDVVRWPEWTASMARVELLDCGPLAVGSRVRISQPKLATLVWTVTELEPGRSFTWTAHSPGLFLKGEHCIDPAPGGRVTVTLSMRQGGVLAPLVHLVYGGLTRRYITTEAEGLKGRSEALAPAPGPAPA